MIRPGEHEVIEWTSSGTYVEDRGDIRVLEMRNTGEPQHIARLHPGGEVTRGALLHGFDTQSVPQLTGDGSLLYYRRGFLYRARDLTVVDGCAFIGLTHWTDDVSRATGSLVRVEL